MKRFVWLPVSLCLLCVCCLAALLVAPVAARADGVPSSTPDQQIWVPNDTVYAIATAPDGTTYIGGDFTYIGPMTGSGAALNATSGAADMTFPYVDGTVHAVVADGAGGYFIGGEFTRVGGITRNDIAHILPDGSVDPAFDPNANNSVLTLAVSGQTVYAGGKFTSIGGQTRNNIAALAVSSGLATAWDPDADNEVDALLVSGSTVYAGGWFTSIGGQTRYAIAALDASSGLATTWHPDAGNLPHGNANVSALALSGSTIYAGGYFTSIGGQNRSGIAALNASSGLATTWNPNASGGTSLGSPVVALAVSGSTVYAGGWFTTIGGQSRTGIAALSAGSGLATAWNPDANGFVYTLAVSGSTVYAGGSFTSIGGQSRNHIAALDASSGLATAWDPNANDGYGNNASVNALAVSGSTVYVGGKFTSIGGRSRNHVAALDASGAVTAWNPNANGGVYALAVSGSTVYVSGSFDSIGGQSRNWIAALDASSGLATAWNPNANYWVSALAVSGSTVYAGGNFTTIGGQSRNDIAALDASSGLATAWDPNPGGGEYGYNYVNGLAVSGSTVYVGGRFDSIGGQTRNGIAALDASSGLATAWDPNADAGANALVVSGSTVYVTGSFTSIGGQSRKWIAALDASSGLATAWNPNADGGVDALAVSGSTVYVGGSFTSIGGQTRNWIAALDASSALATAWDPNAGGGAYGYNSVLALAVSGSTVYIGGDFTTIGGQYRTYLARFSIPVPPTVTSPNGGETWTLGSTHDITWSAGNGGKVTIELSRDNGSSWETLFAATANDGSQAWTVSGATTGQALVRISNDKGSASSAATFAIAPALTGSISLNGGAIYATSTAVTIDSSVSGVTEMRFRNGGGSWASWGAYAASTVWTLSAGDGAKTVDAQYRDADGNVLDLSAGITLDSTPPLTTTNAPTGWKHVSVTVTLSPSDAGSGMSGGSARTEYSTDGGTTWTTGTSLTITAYPVTHLTDGITTISYRSVDNAGNVATVQTCHVRLDTRKPTPKAPWLSSARRGRTATLKYRVNDVLPNGGTATVTIKIKTLHGTLKKTLRCGVKAVNTTFSVRFTVPRTWKAGTYRFYVYATDTAGNPQVKVASNKLIVR
jgi:trimeric autotransporter adhesin